MQRKFKHVLVALTGAFVVASAFAGTSPAYQTWLTPILEPGSGSLEFGDYTETIWITCLTTNVTIYYTTDGSEPSRENGTVLETETHQGAGSIRSASWVRAARCWISPITGRRRCGHTRRDRLGVWSSNG